MQLCPVCAWEDTPSEAEYTNSNEVNLIPAQRHFLATGACEDEYLSVVRPPLRDEARSEHWLSFDELRLKLITDIEREFYDVRRDGGTTLHQTSLFECSQADESAMKKAELKDPERSWQEIPAEKLAHLWMSLVYLDDRGFRFYLPAFMRHALRTSSPDISEAEADEALWSLSKGPGRDRYGDRFSNLSRGQKQAAAAFLFLFASFGDDLQTSHATQGLKYGWAAFVPDSLKLALS